MVNRTNTSVNAVDHIGLFIEMSPIMSPIERTVTVRVTEKLTEKLTDKDSLVKID